MHAFEVLRSKLTSFKYAFFNSFTEIAKRMVAMIAYMAHVFDELISSPRTSHYLAIVANRYIQPLATSFAKPQPCERLHRASRVRMYVKYWQTASYSCRFTSTTLFSQSDYLPTDLPLFYTRIEEYIDPAFDYFNILHLNQSLDHYPQWIICRTACQSAENSTEGRFNWYV